MINLNDYDPRLLKIPKNLSGIRLAFHKENLESALNTGLIIKDKGYKLFFQPMISKFYSDLEFLHLIESANKLSPYAFYIVDSFGSMNLNEFSHFLALSDKNLESNIKLGYHAHNNMQLAFSNAINMCESNIKRSIIVDSSVYGMGRGAGNLNTELIANYLNKTYLKHYEVLPLLDLIDSFLMSIMALNHWGFSPAQYLSAHFDCHPNYATFLTQKNQNHIAIIKQILEKIPKHKKITFDKEYIEKLYIDFMENLSKQNKKEANKINISNDSILLIAPGASINNNLKKLKQEAKNSLTISLNHISQIKSDYCFFSNQKRFDKFKTNLSPKNIIITSNILSAPNEAFRIDFKKFSKINDDLVTNAAIIFLNFLIDSGIKSVKIAGLDGFKVGENNYSYYESDIQLTKTQIESQNNLMMKSLKELSKKIKINFITPSLFKGLI